MGQLPPEEDPAWSNNVAIAAFTTEQNLEKPGQIQAFGRIENYTNEELTIEVSLFMDDELFDAVSVTVGAGENNGVPFELPEMESGVLKLEIDYEDDLAVDNVAYAAVSVPRPAKLLLVTPRNDALQLGLQTGEAAKLCIIKYATPAILDTDEYKNAAESSEYDLVIFDQCAPKKLPQANTLFIGSMPPGDQWTAGERQGPPMVTDTDRLHPLTQLIDMGNVRIAEGFSVKPPAGGSELITADIGALFAIAPRLGYEDAVLGFEIYSINEKGEVEVNTDWPIRRSFPTFLFNVIKYLGGSSGAIASPNAKPGEVITLRTSTPIEKIRVKPPSGSAFTVSRDGQSAFIIPNTEQIGVYEVTEGSSTKVSQRFSVNLFDTRESDLMPGPIEIGHEEVKGESALQPTRKELWKWLLLFGLVVLVFEWYVYNRRVYL